MTIRTVPMTIQEAVEIYLEVLAEEGEPIPEDRSDFARIEVAL